MCMFYICTKQVRKLKDCAASFRQPPAQQFQMSVTGVDVARVRTMQAFYRHTHEQDDVNTSAVFVTEAIYRVAYKKFVIIVFFKKLIICGSYINIMVKIWIKIVSCDITE